jgi:RNA polymerase sigma factor (sigma-70 family)
MNQVINKPSLESLISDKNFKSMLEAMAYRAIGTFCSGKTQYVIDRKDLVGEGIAAACAIYDRFDPARATWNTFTFLYAKNAMQTYCKKHNHPFSISEKDARGDFGYISSMGIVRLDQISREGDDYQFDIPAASGIAKSEQEIEEIYFKGLNEPDVTMLKAYIFDNETMYSIAQRHNISKSKVYNIIHRTINRIKERLENGKED